jgi:ribosomal protein S18 acetylase RimI-like enzyme
VRPATSDDTPTLVDLMAEFYAESGYVLDRRHAGEAFSALLADSRLGRVWLIDQGSADAGYVVLTFVYGMEYGGLMAVIDDFYVRPAARNRGAGTAALAQVRELCAELGVRAVTVEVAHESGAAQSVYRRTGFVKTDRQLMTLRLAAATHEE